jgi:hypothetical protein
MTEIQPATIPQEKPPYRALRVPAMMLSYLFHPVFMPTIMAALLYRLTPTSFAGFTGPLFSRLLLSIFIITAFFPIITTLFTKAVGFIESIHMHNAKDRIIPLLGTMIWYFWAHHVAKNINAPFILQVLLLGSFWGVIAVFMINIFMKISMHTAAAGSMLGILIVLMFSSPVNMAIPFFIMLFIAGLIGTARMILMAHHGREIWLGYIVGILVQIGAYIYLS